MSVSETGYIPETRLPPTATLTGPDATGPGRSTETGDTGFTDQIKPRPSDETHLASVEVRAGRMLLGLGARGGPLNWATFGLDLVSGSNIVHKMIKGEPILPTDQLVMGGYFEGSFRDVDDPFIRIIAGLLNSKGINFEAGANLNFTFAGDGSGGLTIREIKITPLVVLPQVGNSQGTYRNFNAPQSTHTWTFEMDGSVTYSNSVAIEQGAVGLLKPPGKPVTPTKVEAPGIRGLMYLSASREVDDPNDLAIGLRQLLSMTDRGTPDHISGKKLPSTVRAGDLVTAAVIIEQVHAALFGDGPPEGHRPDKTTVTGWFRVIQAVHPSQIGTPANVPMPGVMFEGRGIAVLKNDGDPTIRFYSTASSEPFLEISVAELKKLYETMKAEVSEAVDELLDHPFLRDLGSGDAAPPDGPPANELVPRHRYQPDTFEGHQLGAPLDPPEEKSPPLESPGARELNPPAPGNQPDPYENYEGGGGVDPKDLPPADTVDDGRNVF